MMTLYDFLRAGHVKRWHIVNTANTQSIAEHSFLVAMIAMHLHNEIDPLNETDPTDTGVYALFHDITEVRTGDIPTPAKKFTREMMCGPDDDIFSKMESTLLPYIPFLEGHPSDITLACVKMADVIEAAHWISENGMGKHAELVSQKCWQKVKDLVHEYDTYGQFRWYGAVNKVLMALGMPYISRDERISPP